MATNQIYIDAPPEHVFSVLSDPRSYGRWVVGSRKIRAADQEWPAPGTAFDHQVGFGPLRINDHTTVLSSSPPETLELLAHAFPLPPARIRLHLRRREGGTQLRMDEAPANPILSKLIGPPGHLAVKMRNSEALRRLKLLAEGRSPLPSHHLPQRPR